MERIIKILALTNQQTLISEVVQVAAIDIGEPDCKLVNPFWINTLEGTTTLEPFLNGVTRDDAFMMSSDKILTLVDPKTTLLAKYEAVFD